MTKEQENLITLLETIILLQMTVENLEQLQFTKYNKMAIKVKIKALLKEVSPIVEKDYNTVFFNGQNDTQSIILEYEKLVSFISLQQLPSKVALSQMVEAWNLDKKTIEATVHRVIKKHR